MQRAPTNPTPILTLCLAAAIALAACSWAVPADPGLHARLRARGVDAAEVTADAPAAPPRASSDPEAARLYLQHCGRCHEPFAPSHVRAEAWPIYVRRYGPRAGLFGASRARVLAWLQANAH